MQEELAAFNLLVVKQEAMVDKYFCMDYELGRKYNLYVLSWLENIRTCVERKIPLYHAGQGAEKTKAHLGATFIPSFILFKHRQPVIDRLLVVAGGDREDPQPPRVLARASVELVRPGPRRGGWLRREEAWRNDFQCRCL